MLSAAEDMCYSQGSRRTKRRVVAAVAERMEAAAAEETTTVAMEETTTVAAEEMLTIAAEGMTAVISGEWHQEEGKRNAE